MTKALTPRKAPHTITSTTKIPPIAMSGGDLQALAARLNRMAGIVDSMADEGGEITSLVEAEQYRTFARVGVAECERIQDSVGRAIHDAKQAMFAFDQAYDMAQDLQSAIRGQVAERLRVWEESQTAPTEPPPPPEPTAVDNAPPEPEGKVHQTLVITGQGAVDVVETALPLTTPVAPDYSEWGIEHVTMAMVPPAYLRPDGSLDVRQAQRDHYDLGLAVPGVTFRPGAVCIV